MDFKDDLKILPTVMAVIVIFIVFALMIFSIYYVTNVNNSAYIIVKLPDGAIVEGDGSYRNISEETCRVCIDGIWYKTSYNERSV